MPDPNEKLIDLISLHEGVKYRVYDDANGKEIKAGDTLVGHPTIGVGRNVASDGPGITKDEMIKAMQDPKFFAEAQAVLAEYATAKSQLRFERGQKAGTSRKKGTANDIG